MTSWLGIVVKKAWWSLLSPRPGVVNPFQMAETIAYKVGVILTNHVSKSWDDPPSGKKGWFKHLWGRCGALLVLGDKQKGVIYPIWRIPVIPRWDEFIPILADFLTLAQKSFCVGKRWKVVHLGCPGTGCKWIISPVYKVGCFRPVNRWNQSTDKLVTITSMDPRSVCFFWRLGLSRSTFGTQNLWVFF